MGTPRQNLGAKLRGVRELAGLRNVQLAAALGVSSATISRIESGERQVTLPDMEAWADITNAPNEFREELRQLAEEAINAASNATETHWYRVEQTYYVLADTPGDALQVTNRGQVQCSDVRIRRITEVEKINELANLPWGDEED